MFDIEKAWRYHYYLIVNFKQKPSIEKLNTLLENSGGHLFHLYDGLLGEQFAYIVYPFLSDLKEHKLLVELSAQKLNLKIKIECPKLV